MVIKHDNKRVLTHWQPHIIMGFNVLNELNLCPY